VPALAGAVVAVAAVAAWLLWPRVPALDPTLIAVAPFDAIGTGLESWREDAPTLLYSRLDGAGRWRAIPPSVVRARWTERADAATATDLARTVGAGLVLFGHVVSTGNDSVQLEATLFDAAAGRTIYQFRESGPVEPMLRLADAATVEVMAALSRDYVPASIRWSSFGTSDPEAIKEFLTGEEHYRAFRMDSAKLNYEQAIAHDSNFALAWRRLAYASEMAPHPDDVFKLMYQPWGPADDLRLRAAALNRGLAERESLLVVIDSLWAAGRRAHGPWVIGSLGDSLYQRLFNTMETARASYPRDPELLFLLGQLLFEHGGSHGEPPEFIREALAGAVALDSGFIPPYPHLINLELFVNGREAGTRAMQAYVARAGHTPYAAGYRLALEVLAAPERPSERAERQLDSMLAESGLITQKREVLMFLTSVLWLARSFQTHWYVEQAQPRWRMWTLAHFGRLREAYEFSGPPSATGDALFVNLARLGVVPPDTAASVMARYADAPDFGQFFYDASVAMRWWLEQRDSLSLRRVLERCEARLRDPSLREGAAVGPTALASNARAHLALLRGDTAAALAAFGTTRGGDMVLGWPHVITRAELLAATGRIGEADALLGTIAFSGMDVITTIEAALIRGRVNEHADFPERARWGYQYVVDFWADGDPETRPWFDEARAGLERLWAEEER
jgi:hypothetical protein